MSEHANDRGLILTSSEKRCFDIMNNLSEKNRKRIRICHSRNENGMSQDEVLQEHAQDENGVLLSSSLWEGVDLKDDLSRFQIIAKAPYPNLSEKRTKIKMGKFPLWYKSQTLMKLLQGFGRSIRNEDDWAVTYVLDSAAHDLLIQSKTMIPKSYHDVLGFPSYT
jgi:Rad3-related DNA helicase